ncbi:Junction-mediating and -regulatory protein [Liparis tanakae]|uniref:Junction-mediating and-regulatory protein n=1 Tax=Liparis tanakae TaxID=230148 RepID=A0A4Z2FMI4_9TELE|nr:Junction-mediating and -regulatory protein [Liparis tanakae]
MPPRVCEGSTDYKRSNVVVLRGSFPGSDLLVSPRGLPGEQRLQGRGVGQWLPGKRGAKVLEKHKAMDSMVELLQVYPEEDEAYGELLEATTQLYHYLLQPFRDMRELAMLRRQQIKSELYSGQLELLETAQISSTGRPEVCDPVRSGLFGPRSAVEKFPVLPAAAPGRSNG